MLFREKIFILLTSSIFTLSTLAIRIGDDEVVQYIKSEGYNAEAHEVVTDDGYILRVHRVTPRNVITKKPPIIMMHSAFSNSLYWLNTGPNISAGFYFPDHGYDVWLGNVRGSKFSTKHKWLSVESNEYWRFSYHEMGIYDLKTTVDYTLEQTGAKGCFYMGHSQSTTQLFAFLSIRPEYNKKILQSHLMSAIGAFANPRPPIRTLSPLYLFIANRIPNIPYVDMEAANVFGSNLGQFLCTEGLRLTLCKLFNFWLLGGDPSKPLDANTDPAVYQRIIPALSPRLGVQQVTHFVQTAITQKFTLFDYGPEKNLKLYGSRSPPEYPVNRITSPIYLYIGKYDRIFTKKDTDLIAPKLPNAHYMILQDYNHIDFIFARDVQDKVYSIILREMEKASY